MIDPSLDADSVTLTLEDTTGRLWIVANHAIWSVKERAQKVMSLPPRASFVTNLVEIAATGELIADGDAFRNGRRVFSLFDRFSLPGSGGDGGGDRCSLDAA